ncbi:unnamed protein product [Lactuca saligna]|uniref:SWIM-type domain-containing protein n=1 Tax=Lactuca saligna TaxID=75948 RepID=A0AA36E3S0_LACSI|nr:unnamed protein product [Lactuca saligna]
MRLNFNFNLKFKSMSMLQMWEIKPRNQCFDAIRIYEGYPTMFTIKLHHGGRFTKFPGISYIEGKLVHIELVDMDEFFVHELEEVMLKLGYDVPPVIYYHYQLLNGYLEFGLRTLGNDIDVLSLAQYFEHHKIIKVYTEHNETNLLTSFMSPRVKPRAIIEEIPDDVPLPKSNSTVVDFHPGLRLVEGSQSCNKKLCFNLEHTATGGNQDAHVEIDNEGATIGDQGIEIHNQGTPVGDQDTEVHDQGAPIGDQDTKVHDEGANLGDQEVNTEVFDTFDDQPFQFEDFDPFFNQYTFNDRNDQRLGEGCSKGGSEVGNAGGSDGSNEGSEEDNEFVEYKENYVSDIEVDMIGFYMNVYLDVEYVDRGKGVETENEDVDTEDIEDVKTSRSKDSDYWYVKTLLDKHTCVQTRKLRACTAKYISAEIIGMVDSNPTLPLRSIQDQIWKRLQIGVSIHKVQRAKATTIKQVIGDYTKQYDVLRYYLMELQSTNVDTTVKLEGLIPAIAQLYPQAEHRFYLRHIYENMRKKWKTKEAGSDILINNLCEVLNSKLIHGRNKPIISCIEYIRQYLMKRICSVKKVMSKAPGPLTPTTLKLLERNSEASVQYRARWNRTTKYEVCGPRHNQHVVDMTNMSCTCRRWELNGIPCKHAIATIHEMTNNGDKVGELYTYVNKVYWLQTWHKAYSYTMDPINGRTMWPKSTCPFQITPPPHHIQHGRPKTRRKRSADENYNSQMHKHGSN